ncbi:hypothetical protein VNI00_013201 [Paramarasmius palmivorus]|uniref:Metallo-beta-lactamase domain-containing protein n=1 Tax=Paramarasmius palmivorus TaxID=297713 RepID=A0AAW0BZA7_9AGAR
MTLPQPTSNQAYCTVSALQAGFLDLKLFIFIDNASPSDVLTTPSLSFLIQHSASSKKMVVDLGLRKDGENDPVPANRLKHADRVNVPLDVVDSLRKGGLEPSDIDYVCLTHAHFDHIGDPKLFDKSTFVVGGETKKLLNPGYPEDPKAEFASDLLPEGRTMFLDDGWKEVGPFKKAYDFYEDGSLYIIDAAGHLPGHVNVLARTSATGGWLFLGGDSAHHWNLITGESRIAHGVVGGTFPGGCAHLDREASEEHLRRMKKFLEEERTKIIIAHDEAWFRENKDKAFWPKTIESL